MVGFPDLWPRLLPFLRSSETLNWKAALQVCKAKNMVRETVFVMGRMGDTHTALKLIMTKLGDVKEVHAFRTFSEERACR